MINSGLPLVQALDILSRQSENKALQDVTHQVVYDVESGHTVADALRRHPEGVHRPVREHGGRRRGGWYSRHDSDATGDVPGKERRARRQGEECDDLSGRHHERGLHRDRDAADLRDSGVREHVRERESGAAAADAHRDHAVELPQALSGGRLAAARGSPCSSLKRYYKTSNGQLNIDKLLLKVPVLGDMLRKSAVSRFTRTLGTLISSGVSILDGLEITAKTAGNRVIHDAIMESRASIAGGDTISAPLQKSNVFPPMVISMIAVGEQTGGLDEMLTKIADFYDTEVDTAVSGLLSLMEPVMIVFLGVIVGGMVVAMYLPIFDMINAVQ